MNNPELQELRVAMDAMRDEMTAMKATLARLSSAVQFWDEDDGRVTTHLVCHSMEVLDEESPIRRPVIALGSAEQGGYIEVFPNSGDFGPSVRLGIDENSGPEMAVIGTDGMKRACLTCEEDHGIMLLMGPEQTGGVAARARHGGGGSVAVLQKDGKARAVLVHQDAGPGPGQAGTDLLFATGEGKTLLKLHGNERGGLVCVGTPDRLDGVVLTMRDDTPAIMLRGPQDASSIHLMAAQSMACLRVQEGWLQSENAEVSLMAGTFGSSVTLNDEGGDQRADLSAVKGSSSLSLLDEDRRSGVVLSHHAGKVSSLALHGPSEHESIRLLATKDLAALSITSPDSKDTDLTAQVGSSGPQLLLRQDTMPLVMAGPCEHGGVLSAYGREEVQGGIASLSGGTRSGQLSIASRDGTNLMTLDGTDYGGRLLINNDLGFQRAVLGVHEESALLALNNTGTPGVQAVCTELGGVITLHDQEGKIAHSIPPTRRPRNDDDDDDEEDYPAPDDE